MVLENYVILKPEVPARLHFTDHTIERRTTTDPRTGKPTSRNVLILEVDRLDGREVSAKYSIMAEKHAAQFGPYLSDKAYRSYDFIITKHGEGYLTSWSVAIIPKG